MAYDMVEISKVSPDWVELLITNNLSLDSLDSGGTSIITGETSSGCSSGSGAGTTISQAVKTITSSKTRAYLIMLGLYIRDIKSSKLIIL
ncbi:MAG: hypothetical protein JSV71_00655 [Nitrospiraceae bacterium]|nr:MAG: hypothetical protein JSV71_00655 [Nitrospiraceae bacterium]